MIELTPKLSPYLVQVKNIVVQLQQRFILQNISLSVQRGQIVTLIGPNGAGKTTLVRVILGLIKPESGEINWPHPVRIGYMPQRLNLDPILPLTVMRFLTLNNHNNKADINERLAEVGVFNKQQALLNTLSGGEMQRVLLARALIRRPDLLVLDEPIQGVDVMGQYELYELINRIAEQRHCGVLMVSHDLHLVMAATDHVICLNQHICCEGSPDTISQHPAYQYLFDSRAARDLAIYQHHHHCAEHSPHLPMDTAK
jgi:zinc transport system ATP-binding protein